MILGSQEATLTATGMAVQAAYREPLNHAIHCSMVALNTPISHKATTQAILLVESLVLQANSGDYFGRNSL